MIGHLTVECPDLLVIRARCLSTWRATAKPMC